MKILLLLSAFLVFGKADWNTDFEKARRQARSEHKSILINFSGSDWCGPCIRLHKEVFESQAFQFFSGQSLVLVNADFPRLSKNRLSKVQQKQNDLLADLYDPAGHFPYTVLLNEDGKVLASWDGYASTTPEKFVEQLKAVINAGK